MSYKPMPIYEKSPYCRFVFFILLIMNGLVAQSNKSDAVYLTNGSILRGKIIENVVGKYVKIEMVGSSILVIAEQDVDHIMLREAIPLKKEMLNHRV